jgi:hypothetical protein
MPKLCLILCVSALCGCQSSKSPLAPRSVERADDPLLTPYEQHRKVRYLHAYPDDELGPRSGPEKPPLGPYSQ